MIPRIIAFALLVLNSATPAGASYLYWRDGSVTYVPDEIILALLVAGAAACLWHLNEHSSGSSIVSEMSLDLPDEVREPESVEYYDDVTERTRALKRKLDAETELAESYIRAARAKAELEDLDNIRPARTGRHGARGHGRAGN
jgi:hypothetical protein